MLAVDQAHRPEPSAVGNLMTFANLMPIEARQPGTLRFLFPASEARSNPGSYVLVRSDSPITSLSDLGGRTVGTYSGPSQ